MNVLIVFAGAGAFIFTLFVIRAVAEKALAILKERNRVDSERLQMEKDHCAKAEAAHKQQVMIQKVMLAKMSPPTNYRACKIPDKAGVWWYRKDGQEDWELFTVREFGEGTSKHLSAYGDSFGGATMNGEFTERYPGTWVEIRKPQ